MKILIDARCIGKDIHGIARHGINVVKNLSLLDAKNEYILLVNKNGIAHFNILPGNFRVRAVNIKPYGIAEQLVLPSVLKNIDFDLYYTPNYTAPLLLNKKFMFTIHDLIHLIFPDDYSFIHRVYYRTVIARLANSAQKIFTVSESSRRDIMRFFNVPEEKISVVYNGVDQMFSPGSKEEAKELIAKKYNIKGRFLLWVGNRKRHKNLNGAINAFKEIKKNYQDLKFVAILNSRNEKNFSEDVFLLNVHNDDDLTAFYRAAEIAVLPSLYEGFCLPALEAMACGCPVLTSSLASLPEVCGDAAYYVDPYSVESIAEGALMVLRDGNLRQSLIIKGLERAKNFVWEKSAKELLKIFEEAYCKY